MSEPTARIDITLSSQTIRLTEEDCFDLARKLVQLGFGPPAPPPVYVPVSVGSPTPIPPSYPSWPSWDTYKIYCTSTTGIDNDCTASANGSGITGHHYSGSNPAASPRYDSWDPTL